MISAGSIKSAVVALALAGLLTACAETAETINENRFEIGAPLFAGTAGLMGGTAIGGAAAEGGLAAAGLGAGFLAAPYLKKRDVVYFDKAIDQTADAPEGTTIAWKNPNTGTTGKMTRQKDLDLYAVSVCRQLRSEVTRDDTVTTEELVVCSSDGKAPWYIDSAETTEIRPTG